MVYLFQNLSSYILIQVSPAVNLDVCMIGLLPWISITHMAVAVDHITLLSKSKQPTSPSYRYAVLVCMSVCLFVCMCMIVLLPWISITHMAEAVDHITLLSKSKQPTKSIYRYAVFLCMYVCMYVCMLGLLPWISITHLAVAVDHITLLSKSKQPTSPSYRYALFVCSSVW